MKKLTILAAVFTLLLCAVPLMAADYIIGAKGGYFVWKPFLRDIPGNEFSTLESGTGALAEHLGDGDVVFIKGSNASGVHRIARALT